MAARIRAALKPDTLQFPIAPRRVEGPAVTPDGGTLWVGSDETRRVDMVSASDGRVLDSLSGFLYPNRIVIPPAGGRALIADAGCVHVADLGARRLIGDMIALGGSFATSPDGRVAFLPSSGTDVVVADVERRTEIARHRLRKGPHGVACEPTP